MSIAKSISHCQGKGSLAHNNRTFRPKNVDSSRMFVFLSGRIIQREQRIKIRKSLLRYRTAHFLRLVENNYRSVGFYNVNRSARAKFVTCGMTCLYKCIQKISCHCIFYDCIKTYILLFMFFNLQMPS